MPHKIININPLFESKNPRKKLDESIFSHLITGIVAFLFGKKSGIKVQGDKQNIEKFNSALKKIKHDMDHKVLGADADKIRQMAKNYKVQIVKQ